MSLMMTVNFDVRTQMAMTMVMSMTDNIVEGDEDLFLTITSERRRISVCDEDRAVIVIKDQSQWPVFIIIRSSCIHTCSDMYSTILYV